MKRYSRGVGPAVAAGDARGCEQESCKSAVSPLRRRQRVGLPGSMLQWRPSVAELPVLGPLPLLMKTWTIGKRIVVGGITLGGLLALVSAIAWYCLKIVQADAVTLKTDVMPGVINAPGVMIGQAENFIQFHGDE